MLFGTDEQFRASLDELEAAGESVKAEALRISRYTKRTLGLRAPMRDRLAARQA